MLKCQNIIAMLKISILFVAVIPTVILYAEAIETENLSIDELYEKYGLTNPFKKTKQELKYEKRRRNLESRWDFDIDVSLKYYPRIFNHIIIIYLTHISNIHVLMKN